MSIYTDKASGRWLFDFDRYVDGHGRVRRRKLLPKGWTRAQAEAFDRQESAALYALATGIAKPRHNIGEAVSCYARERAPSLKFGAGALREIEAMRDWWDGRPLETLPTVCQEYAADQLGALKPATIRNRIAYLRAACRWAWKRHGLCDADPGARVMVPAVSDARQVVITRAQMIALSRACQHHGVRALIRVLYYSGLRVGEARRAVRRDGLFVLADTKNNTAHILPIHHRALSASRVAMPKRSEVDYWWPKARTACGLEYVRLHDIRHTTASEIIASGGDLGDVGAVLNHKSAASSRRYAHWLVERKAAALAGVGRRAKNPP
jgi:integrase